MNKIYLSGLETDKRKFRGRRFIMSDSEQDDNNPNDGM